MSEKAPTSISSIVSAAAFFVCLALILLDVLLYLTGSRKTGTLFVIGMAGSLFIALCSSLLERRKGRVEDILTMLIGTAFFGWLAWKAFQ